MLGLGSRMISRVGDKPYLCAGPGWGGDRVEGCGRGLFMVLPGCVGSRPNGGGYQFSNT